MDDSNYQYEDEDEVREAFWAQHPQFYHEERTVQMGDDRLYRTDVRVTFCDFVEHLYRNGDISDDLANSVTL